MMNVVPHSGPVVGDAMLFEYVNYRAFSDVNYINVLDEAVGDYAIKCPALSWAKLFSHVYVYSFNHRTKSSTQFYGWPDWTGSRTIHY